MIDLKDASRQEHIAALEATVAQLTARVETLLARRFGTHPWHTRTRPDGGRTGRTATSGRSAPRRRGISCVAAGAMVDDALGDTFAAVLVSDVCAGYARYPGVRQECWTHVLRDLHDLCVAHPDDATVQAWAAGVHGIDRSAGHGRRHIAAMRQAADGFVRELTAVYTPSVAAAVPQRTLSARMAKHLHELFVSVVEPAVPPDNNEAERSLRHLVTSRKISGGRARKQAATRRWPWRRSSGRGGCAERIRSPPVVRSSLPLNSEPLHMRCYR